MKRNQSISKGTAIAFGLWVALTPLWTAQAQGYLDARELLPELVSQPSDPDRPASTSANGHSLNPSLSEDGRKLVFTSNATNLTEGEIDEGPRRAVYLWDRADGSLKIVSRTGTDEPTDGDSYHPMISADGRYVVFESRATNLASEDSDPTPDIYLRDLETGELRLLSRSLNGESGNAPSELPIFSPTGSRILFRSEAGNLVAGDDNGMTDLFLYDLTTEELTVVTAGVDTEGTASGAVGLTVAENPVFSRDGSVIAYDSTATNLVVDDDNNARDVFLYEIESGTTELVSLAHTGEGGGDAASEAPILSGDGRFVLFQSEASNLTDAEGEAGFFLRDRDAGTTIEVPVWGPMSQDGRYIAYGEGERWDREGDSPEPEVPEMRPGNRFVRTPLISPDGSRSLFLSHEPLEGSEAEEDETEPLPSQLYLRDFESGSVIRISRPVADQPTAHDPMLPSVSRDWTTVAFHSFDDALVESDRNQAFDVFVADIDEPDPAGLEVDLVSARDPDIEGSAPAERRFYVTASFSDNGERLLLFGQPFEIADEGLDPTILHGFVYDLSNGDRIRLGLDPNEPISAPTLSPDGEHAAFVTRRPHPGQHDEDSSADVYVTDISAGETSLVSRTPSGEAGGNGPSGAPRFSPDGESLLFTSQATNLHPDQGDERNFVLRYDLEANENDLLWQGVVFGLPDPNNAFIPSWFANPAMTPDERFLQFVVLRRPTSPYPGQRDWDYSDPTRPIPARSAGSVILVDRQDGEAELLIEGFAHNITESAGRSRQIRTRFNRGGTRLAYAFRNERDEARLEVFDLGQMETVLRRDHATRFSMDDAGTRIAYQTTVERDDPAFTDIYTEELAGEARQRVSVAIDGGTGNGHSTLPTLGPDGRFVLFESAADNLVPNDGNRRNDVFLRDLQEGTTFRLSAPEQGDLEGFAGGGKPVFSPDGRTLLFQSRPRASSTASPFASDLFLLRLQLGFPETEGPDTDEDRLPDTWERFYFGNLRHGAEDDPDGDGASNLDEQRAGTSPRGSRSVLEIITLTSIADGQTRILWKAVEGQRYRVEFKDSLDEGWQPLEGEVTADGPTASAVDPDTPGPGRRFYRVIAEGGG